jgi:hypothetical protein
MNPEDVANSSNTNIWGRNTSHGNNPYSAGKVK